MRGVAWTIGAGAVALAMACQQAEPESGQDTDPGLEGIDQEPVDAQVRTGTLPAPEDARLYFIEPQDGDTVRSPVQVRFGLQGMGVAPAGVDVPETGHHHLLVNEPEVDMDAPLPDPEGVIFHFGGGQTEAEIELEPGEHTLQAVLGDWKHQPHDPPVTSERITIVVEN